MHQTSVKQRHRWAARGIPVRDSILAFLANRLSVSNAETVSYSFSLGVTFKILNVGFQMLISEVQFRQVGQLFHVWWSMMYR